MSHARAFALVLAAGVVAFVLSACGGGGGGGTRPSDSVPAPSTQSGASSGSGGTGSAPPSPPPPPLGSGNGDTSTGTYASLIAAPLTPVMDMPSSESVRVRIPELGIDETFSMADAGARLASIPVLSHTSGNIKTSLTTFLPGQTGLNLQYSNLGVWDQYDLASNTLKQTVVVSFGAKTLGSDIPAAGTATYSGFLIGSAVETGGSYSIWAMANATASFSDRIVSFASNQSLKTDKSTGLITPDAGYNLSGTLGYNAGVNALSGALTSANGKNGPGAGAFYGPQAQELHVTFRVTSPGGTQPFVGGAALKTP